MRPGHCHVPRYLHLIGAAPSAFAPGCFAKRIETAHLAEAIQYRPRWQV
jgi:hypothetical protein